MFCEKQRSFSGSRTVPANTGSQREWEQDRKRMQSYYSPSARQLQKTVEQFCDQLDYPGSMMYDECPDQRMMERAGKWLGAHCFPGQELSPEQQDLLSVLLCGEMHQRRCRKRMCRMYF